MFSEVGSSYKENIGGGVKSSFRGVLKNADDETNTNNLHGDIVGNTK